jgi:predicted transcriptional regulator
MLNKLIKPTESELEILQVLWDRGPSSVREVNVLLNKQRETGYNTTIKFMQIMLEKGLVSRNTEKRSHIYHARVEKHEVQTQLLSRFLAAAYKGSASQLVLQLLGNHKASKDELEEIKALIEKIEKTQK